MAGPWRAAIREAAGAPRAAGEEVERREHDAGGEGQLPTSSALALAEVDAALLRAPAPTPTAEESGEPGRRAALLALRSFTSWAHDVTPLDEADGGAEETRAAADDRHAALSHRRAAAAPPAYRAAFAAIVARLGRASGAHDNEPAALAGAVMRFVDIWAFNRHGRVARENSWHTRHHTLTQPFYGPDQDENISAVRALDLRGAPGVEFIRRALLLQHALRARIEAAEKLDASHLPAPPPPRSSFPCNTRQAEST